MWSLMWKRSLRYPFERLNARQVNGEEMARQAVWNVEYCLESVEEYSECMIHKGEPEPRKGNVNTVYFINQIL